MKIHVCYHGYRPISADTASKLCRFRHIELINASYQIGLLSYMFVGIEIGAHGGGVHQWDVPLTRVIRAFQVCFFESVLLILGAGC